MTAPPFAADRREQLCPRHPRPGAVAVLVALLTVGPIKALIVLAVVIAVQQLGATSSSR